MSDIESERKWSRSESFVTTEDKCSNCGSKLSNAETSRLQWQEEAHKGSKRIRQLETALRQCVEALGQLIAPMTLSGASRTEIVEIIRKRDKSFDEALTSANAALEGGK